MTEAFDTRDVVELSREAAEESARRRHVSDLENALIAARGCIVLHAVCAAGASPEVTAVLRKIDEALGK